MRVFDPGKIRNALGPALEMGRSFERPDVPRKVGQMNRLFVVPGGVEGADTGPISTGAIARSGGTAAADSNRVGLFAGIAAGVALLAGGGLFLTLGQQGGTQPPAVVQEAPAPAASPGRSSRSPSSRSRRWRSRSPSCAG